MLEIIEIVVWLCVAVVGFIAVILFLFVMFTILISMALECVDIWKDKIKKWMVD